MFLGARYWHSHQEHCSIYTTRVNQGQTIRKQRETSPIKNCDSLSSFWPWTSFWTWTPLDWRSSLVSKRKECNIQQMIPQRFLKKPMVIQSWNHPTGKERYAHFLRIVEQRFLRDTDVRGPEASWIPCESGGQILSPVPLCTVGMYIQLWNYSLACGIIAIMRQDK